jgi:hypothetical protein
VRPARFEHTTYGFVDITPEFPDFLKLGQLIEIVKSGLVRFSTPAHVLADFGKFFTEAY